MSKHARIVDSTAMDVVIGDPAEFFHPDIAKDFVPVPDQVESGWSVAAGKWSAPTPIEPTTPTPVYPKVSPIEFKLLWSSPERLTLKAARATDPVVDDFFDIIEDPRLTHVDLALTSTQQGVDYCLSKLVTANVLQQADVPARREQILSGQLQ